MKTFIEIKTSICHSQNKPKEMGNSPHNIIASPLLVLLRAEEQATLEDHR
jgi:hypothetical protein